MTKLTSPVNTYNSNFPHFKLKIVTMPLEFKGSQKDPSSHLRQVSSVITIYFDDLPNSFQVKEDKAKMAALYGAVE